MAFLPWHAMKDEAEGGIIRYLRIQHFGTASVTHFEINYCTPSEPCSACDMTPASL